VRSELLTVSDYASPHFFFLLIFLFRKVIIALRSFFAKVELAILIAGKRIYIIFLLTWLKDNKQKTQVSGVFQKGAKCFARCFRYKQF